MPLAIEGHELFYALTHDSNVVHRRVKYNALIEENETRLVRRKTEIHLHTYVYTRTSFTMTQKYYSIYSVSTHTDTYTYTDTETDT